MNKFQTQKGITLIALIIAILILLILSVIVISSVRNNKILIQTNETKNKFDKIQSQFNGLINQKINSITHNLTPSAQNNVI